MDKFYNHAFQGRNKYGNKRVGSHASKKEHYRAGELRMMQRAGLISDLREQVSYLLIPAQYGECGKDFKNRPTRVLLERPCSYVADFVYTGYRADHRGRHKGSQNKGVYHQAKTHAARAWYPH